MEFNLMRLRSLLQTYAAKSGTAEKINEASVRKTMTNIHHSMLQAKTIHQRSFTNDFEVLSHLSDCLFHITLLAENNNLLDDIYKTKKCESDREYYTTDENFFQISFNIQAELGKNRRKLVRSPGYEVRRKVDISSILQSIITIAEFMSIPTSVLIKSTEQQVENRISLLESKEVSNA